MTRYTRMKPEERKRTIILAALKLTWETGGFDWTKQDVADKCEPPCSVDTVKHYFRHHELVDLVKGPIKPTLHKIDLRVRRNRKRKETT